MKASDYIARFLAQQGVTHVFEVSGGMITHLLDSCHRLGAPRLISVRHEQAAGFAAEGMARATGVPGVAMATSGPGATNLLTAIGSLYFDSFPAVFITGQVNRNELKGNRDMRQAGFQETDIVSMARPVTKAAWLVDRPDRLPGLLQEAFDIARRGRPGPVLLDIPMDVLRADVDVPDEVRVDAPQESGSEAELGAVVDEMLGLLRAARRPMILAGGGLRSGRVVEGFRQWLEVIRVPVAHSLMAVDVLPHEHPCRVGMLGSYGNRWTNLAVGASDFLLVLGSRLDIRQTGADVAAFQAGREIVHVDIDPGELRQRITGCRALCADLRRFLPVVLERLGGATVEAPADWFREIADLRGRWPDTAEVGSARGINPNGLMHILSRVSGRAAAYVVDVGQHQMWAAQSLELGPRQRFLTSGGMGSMGFALPAGVGVALAAAPQPVVVIAGDGGFQHNVQELQTVRHHRLPLKMVVLNNRCHGMVRQFQQSYFESRFPSTRWGYSPPDFKRVAEAYDISALTVEHEAEVAGALAELWRDPNAPFLLQVVIDPETNVYPKIAFGRPFTEMEPMATPIEMEST
ncbi:MAG TPA: thiamine pyrophosphate-binding protein [Verrucomicrobiota bacterium]|nr:thiamine pyrophosphate-binding protein [Verrucomicrobiota bacterium]HNU51972.1 thiamine pyrophosphate-binding protein [Verrucomicrobiota bacterium]